MRFRSLSLPRLSQVCHYFDNEIHDIETTELKSGEWCIRLRFTVDHPPIAAIAQSLQLCEQRLLKMLGTVGLSLAQLRIDTAHTQPNQVVKRIPRDVHAQSGA